MARLLPDPRLLKIKPGKHSLQSRQTSEAAASESDDNLWLITLADLMSLLLVCFVMFFMIGKRDAKVNPQTSTNKSTAASVVVVSDEEGAKDFNIADFALKGSGILDGGTGILNEGKGNNRDTTADKASSQSESSEEVLDRLNSAISKMQMEDVVSVVSVNSDVVITLKESITFFPGRARILSDSVQVLDHIAEIISTHANYVVEIDGHTDNVPISTAEFPSNWELSSARATSVLRYFTEAHGLDESRFYIKGNAASRPIAPNDTSENRAKNRRVEIRLKEIKA